jgi:hypothetical protein
MKAKFDIIPLSVCEDCISYIANNELTEDKEKNRLILDGIERECKNGADIVMGEDIEEGFSGIECDLCRDGMAGNRYSANLLVPIKKPKKVIKST